MRMRTLGTLVAIVLGWTGGAALAAGAPDGIELLLAEDASSKVVLQWTGGAPDFAVHRGLDAGTAGEPAQLRTVTDASSWVGTNERPGPGQVFHYLVEETDLVAGTLPAQWIDGTECATEPSIQIHQYNADTFILRQSLCTNFEGPFIYLLFGEDRVLMLDTGAGGIPLADTVYGIVDQWLFDNGPASIELVVAHTHAHGDHVQGDGQFQGQPDTTIVGWTTSAVQSFFGFTSWPEDVVAYDLGGGRVLDVLAIPGHHPAHIAFYDRQTGLLLTGDTLYPGRLYVASFGQYVDSIQRLVDFVADRPVPWVLGTHIEMTSTPFEDFPFGSTVHADEHPLDLDRGHLDELLEAVEQMQGDPQITAFPDFIVWPL